VKSYFLIRRLPLVLVVLTSFPACHPSKGGPPAPAPIRAFPALKEQQTKILRRGAAETQEVIATLNSSLPQLEQKGQMWEVAIRLKEELDRARYRVSEDERHFGAFPRYEEDHRPTLVQPDSKRAPFFGDLLDNYYDAAYYVETHEKAFQPSDTRIVMPAFKTQVSAYNGLADTGTGFFSLRVESKPDEGALIFTRHTSEEYDERNVRGKTSGDIFLTYVRWFVKIRKPGCTPMPEQEYVVWEHPESNKVMTFSDFRCESK